MFSYICRNEAKILLKQLKKIKKITTITKKLQENIVTVSLYAEIDLFTSINLL